MRRVAVAAVRGLAVSMVSACGDSGESELPAAETDASVRPATATAMTGAQERQAKTSAGPGARRDPGVLRGRFERLNGESVDLADYGGRVVLVVNTATECGYTPQFEGLEALYRERRAPAGLVVLGSPANDFAGQEPRSDKEIATFCKANYGVSFPMFSKTHVTGDAANRSING